jgi:hypothetical protein
VPERRKAALVGDAPRLGLALDVRHDDALRAVVEQARGEPVLLARETRTTGVIPTASEAQAI